MANDDSSALTILPERVPGHAPRLLRVGLLGLGLEAYWSQFAGLRQR
jgi:hypothetical protein